MQVLVRDNNIDQALRVLKKKMQREGVFREMKQRKSYEKPSERKNREKSEAIRRGHMIDEEGGRVDRLRHLLPGLPSVEAFGEGEQPVEKPAGPSSRMTRSSVATRHSSGASICGTRASESKRCRSMSETGRKG